MSKPIQITVRNNGTDTETFRLFDYDSDIATSDVSVYGYYSDKISQSISSISSSFEVKSNGKLKTIEIYAYSGRGVIEITNSQGDVVKLIETQAYVSEGVKSFIVNEDVTVGTYDVSLRRRHGSLTFFIGVNPSNTSQPWYKVTVDNEDVVEGASVSYREIVNALEFNPEYLSGVKIKSSNEEQLSNPLGLEKSTVFGNTKLETVFPLYAQTSKDVRTDFANFKLPNAFKLGNGENVLVYDILPETSVSFIFQFTDANGKIIQSKTDYNIGYFNAEGGEADSVAKPKKSNIKKIVASIVIIILIYFTWTKILR